MVNIDEKNKEIIKIEKHGDWVKDDLDKIIEEVLVKGEEYTTPQLKNKVLDKLIQNISKGQCFDEKIRELIKIGVIKSRDKESRIKLFSINKEEQ
jgi:16S rRNA U1498 N3-methylase RsmE